MADSMETIKEVIAAELVSKASPAYVFHRERESANASSVYSPYVSEEATAPNPGLFVKHVGEVGLPLRASDAEALMAHGRPSPVGRGSETIVDTFELEPGDGDGQFELRSPAWTDFIKTVVDRVYAELGLACGRENVEARLHRLLLPGNCRGPAVQAAAVQSPGLGKAEGTFGSLVVSLGSAHRGGSVVLEHRKKKYVYDSSRCPSYAASFAAWYANVSHEVQQVTDGSRLVLAYDLVQRGTALPERAGLSAGSKRLANALSEYDRRLGEEMEAPSLPVYLAYKLELPYTDESIGLHSLDSRDRALVGRFKAAGKDAGYSFYLAAYTKSIRYREHDYGFYNRGLYDEEDEDDDQYHSAKWWEMWRKQCFDAIYDLNGEKMDFEPEYNETALLDGDNNYATDDDDEDESEHAEYTGRGGGPGYRTYRDTMLLAVPPATRSEVWLTRDLIIDAPAARIQSILDQLRSEPQSTVEGSPEYYHLRRLCRVLARWHGGTAGCGLDQEEDAEQSGGTYLDGVIEESLKHGWLSMYWTIRPELRVTAPALDVLVSYLSRVGMKDGNEAMVYDLIDAHCVDAQAKFDVLVRFDSRTAPTEEVKQRPDAFRRKIGDRLVQKFDAGRTEDGTTLANILIQHGGAPSDVADTAEQIIQAAPTVTQAAFVMRWANQLGPVTSGEHDDDAAHRVLVGRLLDVMWANFTFQPPPSSHDPVTLFDLPPEGSVSAEGLAALLDLTATYHAYTTSTPVKALSAMQKALGSIPPLCDTTNLFALAQKICKNEVKSLVCAESANEEVDKAVRAFVVECFVTVIQMDVGPEPQRAKNLSLRPPESSNCNKGNDQFNTLYQHYYGQAMTTKSKSARRNQPCDNCERVIKFLASPTEERLEFAVGEVARKHLDGQFQRSHTIEDGPFFTFYCHPFRTEVVRQPRGKPFHWRIVKLQEDTFRADHERWRGRVRSVGDALADCLAVEGNVLAAAKARGPFKGRVVRWPDVVAALASAKLEDVQRLGLTSPAAADGEARAPLASTSANRVRKRAADGGGQKARPGKRGKIGHGDLLL